MEDATVPGQGTSGNAALDEAIAWLCGGTDRVLDFGCGNGVMQFLCAQNGTRDHVGIDLSDEAILCAQRKAAHMSAGVYRFERGGVEAFSKYPNESFDAVILSNIVDNLFPEDATQLISESARVLKAGGKVLVKLNPYLTQEQIAVWNIKAISGNLLDDGLILWNNTTEEWRDLFTPHFTVYQQEEVYYPEYKQTNRLFYLVKL
ncbi:MAG: class I SAM-dependent methyltransferase [Christensenella sp.]|nr:class I SAM-dependent methyltransferase [Christensenella sp.]